MDLVQIGKFIAELRKEQKLTQEQFGEKIDESKFMGRDSSEKNYSQKHQYAI